MKATQYEEDLSAFATVSFSAFLVAWCLLMVSKIIVYSARMVYRSL